jgi:hypothetical protein
VAEANGEMLDQVAEPGGPAYVVKNRLRTEDGAVHGWYRFVLGYPPHLVREYLERLEADSLAIVEFDDHEDPNELGIVSVSRFRLIRRGSS